MSYAEQWTVTIDISEEPGRTRATARLTTRDDTRLVGAGEAHRHPQDREVPEIGAELAVARLLSVAGILTGRPIVAATECRCSDPISSTSQAPSSGSPSPAFSRDAGARDTSALAAASAR